MWPSHHARVVDDLEHVLRQRRRRRVESVVGNPAHGLASCRVHEDAGDEPVRMVRRRGIDWREHHTARRSVPNSGDETRPGDVAARAASMRLLVARATYDAAARARSVQWGVPEAVRSAWRRPGSAEVPAGSGGAQPATCSPAPPSGSQSPRSVVEAPSELVAASRKPEGGHRWVRFRPPDVAQPCPGRAAHAGWETSAADRRYQAWPSRE